MHLETGVLSGDCPLPRDEVLHHIQQDPLDIHGPRFVGRSEFFFLILFSY